MLKQIKQLNELDSLFAQVENLQKQNLELADELKAVREELKTIKAVSTQNATDISQTQAVLMEATQTLKNDVAEIPVAIIGETSIGESVLSYHLRTSPQTQSKNYRYFYKSNYLFTAPLNLKNLLTIEFNRLMNSNLSFESVVEELKTYKESLALELKSNGIQTELGGVINGK